MFKLSGEKLNLPSGMASAASTICFSMVPISRSTLEAMVGGGGDCCARGTLAAAGTMSTEDSAKIRIAFPLILSIMALRRIQQLLDDRITFHHHEVPLFPGEEAKYAFCSRVDLQPKRLRVPG